MLTAKQIKEMENSSIISCIFYHGVASAHDKTTKASEKELVLLYKELERRGVVDDWETAYKKVCN